MEHRYVKGLDCRALIEAKDLGNGRETMRRGTALHPDDRREVLAAFVNRFTIERTPAWARGTLYKPQFRDDQDWLANTLFHVRRNGRLDRRFKGCQSTPTWPLGKGCAEAGRHAPGCEHGA